MNADWRNRYEVAVQAAQNAGKIALKYFDAALDVEWKHDNTPVTVADREAEQLLRASLLEHFPNDGFLGEEFGDTPGSSGFRWVIDPIDGTRSFVRGVPLWATLVGLEYKDEQIAGVAVVPALGQTFRALRGDGAFRDDQPIHVSNVKSLEQSHLYYSSISWFLGAGKEQMFLNLVRATERQRGFGDFYGFVMVAQGSGELMCEWGCKPWDLAALSAIIHEAGGKMTDWSDERTIHRHDVLASNGLVHEQALAILRGDVG